jgi:hypothetical protein
VTYTEEEVLQVAGWDAVVYLRILKFGETAPVHGARMIAWWLHPRVAPDVSDFRSLA